MRVLELGPGGGFMTERVVPQLGPEGRLVCLDLQPAMLKKVRARLGAAAPALVCASGSALPFRTGTFDLVFLVSVLGEIPDHEGAVRECARILRPGGRLAVTEDVGDPDYVRTPVLRRWAARAGLEPGERLGSVFRYTYRFGKPAGARASVSA
jgi:ubiquinone/menaquinone biosynthesis C-methylase UbiE